MNRPEQNPKAALVKERRAAAELEDLETRGARGGPGGPPAHVAERIAQARARAEAARAEREAVEEEWEQYRAAEAQESAARGAREVLESLEGVYGRDAALERFAALEEVPQGAKRAAIASRHGDGAADAFDESGVAGLIETLGEEW